MTVDELVDKHISPMRSARADKAFRRDLDILINETVHLNRIELALDIKHRHWVNDKLRDTYLDAVISVANEALEVEQEGRSTTSERTQSPARTSSTPVLGEAK